MKTIRNTTHQPIAVPLPRGKKLHLGPLKSGEIAVGAEEHPPLAKLVEEGKIEIVGDGTSRAAHASDGGGFQKIEPGGHAPASRAPRSGER